MVFHLVGLGLSDEEDITLKGLKAIQSCTKVYLEAYTSILTVPRERLEKAWGVKIELAPRELVESEIEPILQLAQTENVAVLVVGDPFGATTHCDLLARAHELGVPTNVVHNASIMNAIGCCGLQLYRFGETVSLCFFSSTWRPDSFYDKVLVNAKAGLHTLVLLDIKVREPTIPSLARGRPQYMEPRFMSVRQAAQQLLLVEASRKGGVCVASSRAVGVARVGAADQLVVAGTLAELIEVDFGGPLHSMVLLGDAHGAEEELLSAFCRAPADAPKLSTATAAALDRECANAAATHAGEALCAEESSDDESGGMNTAELAVLDALDLKEKQADASEKAAEKDAQESDNASRTAALEASGKRAAGGVHKFDASEVDVNGGDATAEDFMDAFGF